MADPRFYDNRGPFTLADVCAHSGVELPVGADGSARIFDLATLEGAGSQHLAFCAGKPAYDALARTKAGFCFVSKDAAARTPAGTVGLPCASPQHAFTAALNLFYPENMLAAWSQQTAVDPSARIGSGVMLGPGVVIGPNVEIGDRTCIGPNAVIGRGVSIGRDCQIGSNVTIANSYIGDGVAIFPGTQIGQPGFGFASSPAGHIKIPQIGRVIVQDKVAVTFGCWTSVSRKSALPVFEAKYSKDENPYGGGLLFYPVQYEGEEQSPNVFYTGASPNEQLIPAAEYMMSKDGGSKKKFYLLGTDYVFPRTANKVLKAYLISEGVSDARTSIRCAQGLRLSPDRGRAAPVGPRRRRAAIRAHRRRRSTPRR